MTKLTGWKELQCWNCHKSFHSLTRNKKYCSNKCRQNAYRVRKLQMPLGLNWLSAPIIRGGR